MYICAYAVHTHTHAIQMLPFQVFQLFMIYRRDVEVTLPNPWEESAMLDQCLSREALEALAQIPCSGEAWGLGESVTSRLVHLTCPSVPLGGREFLMCNRS